MKITVESIRKLKPCKSRFKNFTDYYPKFSGTLSDFIALENITYLDKVWVATRILSKNQLVKWSIMCAESVRHIYEEKYPESKVLSELLSELFDYMNSISDFENLSENQKSTLKILRNAAYAADYASHAAYAAYAAAHAAYDAAAYAAAHAATAAAYAATAAAYTADYASHAAAHAREEQSNLNLLLLSTIEGDLK